MNDMTTTIYWFSGTGNSFHAAARIGAALEAELVPIASPTAAAGEPADRIGIVFPVYGFGAPAIVMRFIEQMPVKEGSEAFCVATCGGMAGAAVSIVERLLKTRGVTLTAGYVIRMPDNYPPFGGAPRAERSSELNDKAEARIAEIAGSLKSGTGGRIERPTMITRAAGGFISYWFTRSLAKTDRKFFADGKCNGCEICAKVCPVDNIEIADGIPNWLGHCEQCYACFHWCPQKAVQYGKRTENQVRYHHPGCRLEDMMVRGG
jgi:Pyruvate/2-oxoacid:ferredoxin oxidoreductase delta subunit